MVHFFCVIPFIDKIIVVIYYGILVLVLRRKQCIHVVSGFTSYLNFIVKLQTTSRTTVGIGMPVIKVNTIASLTFHVRLWRYRIHCIFYANKTSKHYCIL